MLFRILINFIICVFLFNIFILPSSIYAQQLISKDRKLTTLEYIQKVKQDLGMDREAGLEDEPYNKEEVKSSPEKITEEKETKEPNQR